MVLIQERGLYPSHRSPSHSYRGVVLCCWLYTSRLGAGPGGGGHVAYGPALRGLLTDLGIKTLYLGGHDFGDPVALNLMRLFPELEIKGLVPSAKKQS